MQHAVPTVVTPPTGPETTAPDAEPLPPPARKPPTLLVLLMFVAAAAAFSYLWAYAATDVLVSVGLATRWPDGTDPRPVRFGTTLAGVLGALLLVGTAARVLSGRQLKRIDAMADG